MRDKKSAQKETTIEYPFGSWVEELVNLNDPSLGEPALSRMEWITNKLDILGIPFECFEPNLGYNSGNCTEFTAVSFSIFRNEIIVPFIISVEPVDWGHVSFDYSTGIVQMLMLAKKLNETAQSKNISIIFVGGKDPKISADHLSTSIQERQFGGLVDFLVFPTCFTGDCLTVDSPYGSGESILHDLMIKQRIDLSAFEVAGCDLISRTELLRYDYLTIGSDFEDCDSPGYNPDQSVKDEVQFARSTSFLKINSLLHDFALIVSREADEKNYGIPLRGGFMH